MLKSGSSFNLLKFINDSLKTRAFLSDQWLKISFFESLRQILRWEYILIKKYLCSRLDQQCLLAKLVSDFSLAEDGLLLLLFKMLQGEVAYTFSEFSYFVFTALLVFAPLRLIRHPK